MQIYFLKNRHPGNLAPVFAETISEIADTSVIPILINELRSTEKKRHCTH